MPGARVFVSGLLFAAIVVAVKTIAPDAVNDPPVVTTESGALRGSLADGVLSFKGVPFAAPPIGDFRWRAPQPVEPWKGFREATKFGMACMQAGAMPKSEDCLTLNVWRPAAKSDASLPVMVWIYGGALAQGQTSLYPADALARQGVVVVSMNYRLGRLGFFAHPALLAETPDEIHGNYGYMDQRAALVWVQRNIAAFGGDPKAVTIFGESAGGGSVMVHLTSPLSHGLFQRVLMQSPGLPTARTKVLPLAEMAEAERIASDYARSLGVASTGAAALRELRALSAERLAEGASAQEVVAALSAGAYVSGVAGPMRDGKLVVEAPEEAIAAGRQAMVPVIVGANDRDFTIGAAENKERLFALFGPFADDARKIHDPGDDAPFDELRQQILADKTMTEPARHLADLTARAGQSTWLYRFSYVPESRRGGSMGAAHGSEIPFIFDLPSALVGRAATSADRAMAEMASAYWVAFARTGDPNGADRPLWPRHDPKVDRILNFTNSGTVIGNDPIKARLDLWRAAHDLGRRQEKSGD